MQNLLELLLEYSHKNSVSKLGTLLTNSGNEYVYEQFLESDERVLKLESWMNKQDLETLCNLIKSNLKNLPF